ncbi:transglutaminase domain-containing protein [Sphingomonas sp. So64.6b]|uniref:transglutaminase-like domain-containing protein n=1 Tax=Sphingomonas sp. So64.6b TaxID=2997354 RepID=UPI00160114CD|nr:transglutaminase-like domain-containing protein [Sphingomonas sp. So64.6b]QNA84874.1 transglutaminase domain-containing protein [Sphingomonas sp. So64.6b]
MRVWLNSILGAALFLSPVAASAQDDLWFRIVDQRGQLIGWQHETRESDAKTTRITREREMAFRVEGHNQSRSHIRSVRELDAQGRTIRVSIETSDGRKRRLHLVTVRNDAAAVGNGAPDPENAAEAADEDGQSILYLQELLAAGDPARPASGIRWQRTDGAGTGDLILSAWQNGLPGLVWSIRLDDRGRILRAEQPLPGNSVILQRSDRPISPQELQAPTTRHQMIASPYAISSAALAGHIRYRFALPAMFRPVLPATGEQRTTIEGTALLLDICASCGPGLSTDPSDLARWRAASAWIESDAPELRSAVRGIAAAAQDDVGKMKRLERLARRRLKDVDFDGHYSALQSWRRRAGDCTEDATLLAGLARAAGIPARVASGLIYSRERYHGARNAFMPHSWVVAYVDGSWKSFDISFGSFDASHIALAIGDGEPWAIGAATQVAGLLDWQGMTEVRKRPASPVPAS